MAKTAEVEDLARLLFSLRYAEYHWADAKEPERNRYRADAQAILDAGWRRDDA